MLAGYNDFKALPPEARDEVRRQWARLTPAQPVLTYDLRIPGTGGASTGSSNGRTTLVFAGDGQLVEYQSVGRDITAATGRAGPSRERGAISHDHRGSARVHQSIGSDYKFTFVNLAYAQHLGRPREQLIGTSVLELIRMSSERRLRAQLAALSPSHPTVTYEMEGNDLYGRTRIEQWTIVRLLD